MEKKLILENESYRIRGTCFEVYKEKGCGFLESVYHECMELELGLSGIPRESKPPLNLVYKGNPLKTKYEPGFLCFDQIVLELKALKELADEHRAQVQNYLKATGLKLGILANFGHYPGVQIERIVALEERFGWRD